MNYNVLVEKKSKQLFKSTSKIYKNVLMGRTCQKRLNGLSFFNGTIKITQLFLNKIAMNLLFNY